MGTRDRISWEDKDVYALALSKLNERGVDYMVGGAVAVHHYTGWWRATHDLDLYTTMDHVTPAATALAEAGFPDIGEQAPGDREWIYHARKGQAVIDVIWRFANLIDYVSPDWFARAPKGTFLGVDVAFVPIEELMWIKVFVINRHRCDWPDLMRIISAQCEQIDWDRLMGLLKDDWLLLSALVDVFDWQCPRSVGCIPDSVRRRFAELRQAYLANPPDVEREGLLDPWLNLRGDSE